MNPIKQVLLKELEIKNSSDGYKRFQNKIESSKHSIAISIRCGDDYEKYGLLICNNNYYNKSENILKRDNSTFFIFTDNIEKSKK